MPGTARIFKPFPSFHQLMWLYPSMSECGALAYSTYIWPLFPHIFGLTILIPHIFGLAIYHSQRIALVAYTIRLVLLWHIELRAYKARFKIADKMSVKMAFFENGCTK